MGIFRSIRRARILRESLLPRDVWSSLVEEHPILEGLSPAELDRLREMSTLFLHEKKFVGVDGLELTDAMRETIAVQACLPVLELGLDEYRLWKTVHVGPHAFVEEEREYDTGLFVDNWSDADSTGVAHPTIVGVVLSWKDVGESGWGEGYNVVIHEAVHILDLGDGEMNGRPALHEGMDPEEWRAVFDAAFEDLRKLARKKKHRLKIDPYAIEGDDEFFAVTSEHFFEEPVMLRGEYPDVYRLLKDYYRQDPAARRTRSG
jgi:MtfA peptidase